jgi:deazaflavin-dependent oxidoreductase (nitroreductase family)
VPLPYALARFNRLVTNRPLGLFAHLTPPFAVVVHRGRKSGREYRTTVWAFRTDTGFVVALTYGPGTDWVKNVIAGGGATLVRHDGKHDVVRPRIVRDPKTVPGIVRPPLWVMEVTEFMLFDVNRPPQAPPTTTVGG